MTTEPIAIGEELAEDRAVTIRRAPMGKRSHRRALLSGILPIALVAAVLPVGPAARAARGACPVSMPLFS